MNVTDALYVVTHSVKSFTQSSGAQQDRKKVNDFLNDPQNASDEVFFYVAGVHFGNFFAHSSQNFDNAKAALWAMIQTKAQDDNDPNLQNPTTNVVTQPTIWNSDNTLGQVADYLSRNS